MKWLLYIFLLANLVTFFWHYHPGLFQSQAIKQVHETGDAESVPQLVLVREYTSKQHGAQTAVASGQSCFNLGPFALREGAVRIKQKLRNLGVMASLRVSRNRTRPGYWVLLPPEKDRKTARKVIVRLKEKKIKDYFLVATGSKKNAISLGVYSRPDLAQKRLDMIKKLGFSVSVDKVDLPRHEYWLEWPAATDATVDPKVMSRWRKTYPTIGSTKNVCHTMSPPT